MGAWSHFRFISDLFVQCPPINWYSICLNIISCRGFRCEKLMHYSACILISITNSLRLPKIPIFIIYHDYKLKSHMRAAMANTLGRIMSSQLNPLMIADRKYCITYMAKSRRKIIRKIYLITVYWIINARYWWKRNERKCFEIFVNSNFEIVWSNAQFLRYFLWVARPPMIF